MESLEEVASPPLLADSVSSGKKVYTSTKKIQTVTEDLGYRIKKGEWEKEMRLPTQSQLAREYGVSQSAIALAMRPLQKEGRLRLVPGKGAFIPRQDEVSQKPPHPAVVGIQGSYVNFCKADHQVREFVEPPQQFNTYSASVLQAIWNVAQQEKCPLMLLPTSGAKLTRQSCQSHGVQGVLFLGGESYPEALDLRRAGFPVITANPPSGPTPVNYVENDHASCLRDGLRELIGLGHRRIAVLAPNTTTPESFQKLKPLFIETLCSAGIICNFEAYWRFIPFDPMEVNLQAQQVHPIAAVEELLALEEPPTAIFCLGGFYITPVVHQTLQRHGLHVPRDISLLCAPFVPTIQPLISGYAFQFESMARELLGGILATIQDPFYSIQKLIPFHPLTDCGTLAPPLSLSKK